MPIYSDINAYTPTKRPILVDVEAVYQSLINILNTPTGVRFFNPEFGSDIEPLLFEPVDDITAMEIRHNLVLAVQRWDPRLELDYNKTQIIPSEDQNRYDVLLAFILRGVSKEIFEFKGGLESPNQT